MCVCTKINALLQHGAACIMVVCECAPAVDELSSALAPLITTTAASQPQSQPAAIATFSTVTEMAIAAADTDGSDSSSTGKTAQIDAPA